MSCHRWSSGGSWWWWWLGDNRSFHKQERELGVVWWSAAGGLLKVCETWGKRVCVNVCVRVRRLRCILVGLKRVRSYHVVSKNQPKRV
ncbi:hypothetical protein HanIR_Chr06g0260981 [Helianthus annuus]|nr:hypothetical protein HanIR_Chr06g0260981 [Helianthus annuus]